MKVSKNQYLKGFCLVVIALGVIRAVFPSVAMTADERRTADSIRVVEDSIRMAAVPTQENVEKVAKKEENSLEKEEISPKTTEKSTQEEKKSPEVGQSRFFKADGTVSRHRILSVTSYSEAFPDAQEVQIVSAHKWGVSPVLNRQEAEERKAELVYVGSNPYFFVEPLNQSIPYLVPRASELLSLIGRSYFDSLYVKGIPLHRIIVSSVLRTEDDVARLKARNGNATEQSCHRYGTTFDICYNRYSTVSPPGEPERRTVQSDTLKWVLSEVLRDIREQGRCYIKYEVKQGCFHITVR